MPDARGEEISDDAYDHTVRLLSEVFNLNPSQVRDVTLEMHGGGLAATARVTLVTREYLPLVNLIRSLLGTVEMTLERGEEVKERDQNVRDVTLHADSCGLTLEVVYLTSDSEGRPATYRCTKRRNL